MNYGIILASGKGKRIKDNIDIPKQYRKINNIPVIIYTITKFLNVKSFDYILIAVSDDYTNYVKKLIEYYFEEEDIKKIIILKGGKERIDSIVNSVNKIKEINKITENDIIVIHDAVRPFVSEKILVDSIIVAKEYGAVVTSVPVADTLLISTMGQEVDEIPQRNLYYKGQSPDSFKLKIFIELLSKIGPKEKEKIIGTSQVCTFNNYPIHMIEGNELNFKITTISDLTIAEAVAGEEIKKCLQLKKFLQK